MQIEHAVPASIVAVAKRYAGCRGVCTGAGTAVSPFFKFQNSGVLYTHPHSVLLPFWHLQLDNFDISQPRLQLLSQARAYALPTWKTICSRTGTGMTCSSQRCVENNTAFLQNKAIAVYRQSQLSRGLTNFHLWRVAYALANELSNLLLQARSVSCTSLLLWSRLMLSPCQFANALNLQSNMTCHSIPGTDSASCSKRLWSTALRGLRFLQQG